MEGVVPVCPLCSVPVPLKAGQSRDEALDVHITGGCKVQPIVPKGKPCGVATCRSTHPFKVACQQCKATFCLSHRLPEEHQCPVPAVKPKAPTAQQRLALQSLFRTEKRTSTPSNVGPRNVHVDDRLEFAVYFPQHLGIKPQKVFMPKRWSAGKVVDWLCDHFKVVNNAQKRHRLVTASQEALSVVPNHMTLTQCGTTRDDGTRLPDVQQGVILIPEEWLSAPPVPPAPTASSSAAASSCATEAQLLEILRAELVLCGAQ